MKKQIPFIRNIDCLHVIEKTRRFRLPSFFILLLIFSLSLSLCTLPNKSQSSSKFVLTEEEKTSLKEFFRDLLFKNPGAFTLFGTKPISTSCLYEPLSEEEKEKQKAFYDSLSEEQKATLHKKRYDFEANYQKWQEIKHRFPISQYLFGTFPSPCEEKTHILLFVNIETTLRTLLKYYEDFRRVLGYDFDPFQIVFEVENVDSKFWNAILHNHALQGILLGFGRDNAWFFEWNKKYSKEQNLQSDFMRSLPSTFEEANDIKDPDPKHFLLPIYKSFGLHSDKRLFEQYKKEQTQIMDLYKGRDEVDVALEWLTR
jgi:hypothetical protein